MRFRDDHGYLLQTTFQLRQFCDDIEAQEASKRLGVACNKGLRLHRSLYRLQYPRALVNSCSRVVWQRA
jgi:hypothetical protein